MIKLYVITDNKTIKSSSITLIFRLYSFNKLLIFTPYSRIIKGKLFNHSFQLS